MRKLILLSVCLISLAFLINACKSNSTSTPATGPGSSYFPNGNGTSYKYSFIETDSANNQTSGIRSTTYSGTKTFNWVVYQNEIDTVSFGDFSSVSNSLFVKSGDSVNFAIDTSGLSSSFPDSLLQYIKMSTSIKAFQFPLQENKSWQVFSITISVSGVVISIVNVTGTYIGMDQVPLNLTTGATTMSAAKIQYVLTLSFPNISNPLAPPTTQNYSAVAWLADNVGMIKMQGDGVILDAFTGGGTNFAGSTVTQSLISYTIK